MKGKWVGIEVLRFVSALAVLIWHYQHFYFSPEIGVIDVERASEPLYGLLYPFYEYGWLGVNVFWTISGFIFFGRYLAPLAAQGVSGSLFFVNRFSRLYPLHFVTLIAVALLQAVYLHENRLFFVYTDNSVSEFFVHLFFASGWLATSTDSFNGPVWSVSTELVIYLAFFLLARYARIGLVATLALMCTSAALGGVMIHHQIKGSESNLVFCAFYFFMGGAVQQCYARLQGFIERRRLLVVAACILAYAALIGFCMRFGGTKYLAATVLAPVSIVLLQVIEPWIPARFGKTVIALGNTTYASYLIHFPLQLLTVIGLQAMGIASPVLAAHPAFLVIYLVVVFCLAHLVFLRFEAPMQRMVRRRMVWLGTPGDIKPKA